MHLEGLSSVLKGCRDVDYVASMILEKQNKKQQLYLMQQLSKHCSNRTKGEEDVLYDLLLKSSCLSCTMLHQKIENLYFYVNKSGGAHSES